MASRRHKLSLKVRVKVVECARKNPQVGSRAISEVFGCGILNNKAKEIRIQYYPRLQKAPSAGFT